jgi:50S ribosomal protein L16 3-hydroxylase
MILFPILGDISAEHFLADYWQKKPLLVRGAISDFEPPIAGDELAGLALESEVESRLIVGSDWHMTEGPLTEAQFAGLPEKQWTLLVQAVDLWIPEVSTLLDRFRFLPPWRIDDIMVSYAADGGGVGPHFDYYDVFLLQGSGRRKWQIGQTCDHNNALVDHPNLKILAEFSVTDEWILEPGDMLYIPPRVAHWGTAIGACTTFSIGFRAPSATEMLDDLATDLLSRGSEPTFLTDPPLTPQMANDNIDPAYIKQIRALLLETLNDETMLTEWFAQYMTQPKYPMLLDETGEKRTASVRHSATATEPQSTKHFENGLPI